MIKYYLNHPLFCIVRFVKLFIFAVLLLGLAFESTRQTTIREVISVVNVVPVLMFRIHGFSFRLMERMG